MTAVKERIFGAVSIMDDSDAESVWNYILSKFSAKTWNSIEEVEPDEWDLEMMDAIEHDPECHEFVSEEEAMKQLGLSGL